MDNNELADKKIIELSVLSLLKIGRNEDFIDSHGVPHKKARKIGEILNELGGQTLMLSVAKRVVKLLSYEGKEISREIEICWDRIGGWMA